MSLIFECGSVTMPSVNGNQVVTLTKFAGRTPKVILIWAVNTATSSAECRLVFGAYDGTSTYSYSTVSAFGVGTSDADCSFNSDALLKFIDKNRAVIVQCASCTFGVNQFTLNWTNTGSYWGECQYVVLGGDDLTNAVLHMIVASVSNGDQSIASLGFQPDALIAFGPGGISANPSTMSNHLKAMLGFAVPGIVQKCLTSQMYNATAGGDCRMRQGDYLMAGCADSATTAQKAVVKSFDPNGYTLTWSESTAQSYRFFVLALKGGTYKVRQFTGSASTGVQTIDTLVDAPKGSIIASQGRLFGSDFVNNLPMVFSVGATDGTVAGSSGVRAEDGGASTNTQRYQGVDKCIQLRDAVRTLIASGSMSGAGYLNNNLRINWETALSTDYIMFSVGDAPPSANKPVLWSGVGF